MRLPLFILVLIISSSIALSQKPQNDTPNKKEYKTVIKKIFGAFKNGKELKEFRATLERELKQNDIDWSQPILINFLQRGDYCIFSGMNEEVITTVLKNTLAISHRLANSYKLTDLFVTTIDYDRIDLLQKNIWLVDTGFIENNIFLDNKTCSGFFLLMPTGQYCKYYGEDYFSEVTQLLENKDWYKYMSVNTIYNEEYKESTRLSKGTLKEDELKVFRTKMSEVIKTDTKDYDKTLIISFFQNGKNCGALSGDSQYLKRVMKSYNKLLQKKAKNSKANGYTIYTNDSFFSNWPCADCLMDNGYIKDRVFSSDQNCMGFFVLFPNGEFYKYYGEDYFSIITEVLSGKLDN